VVWDTERTRRLLLDAGLEEFSTHGLAGARVDRIAARAGVNKERIYQYFGKKEQFFDVVVGEVLTRVVEEVPLGGHGPEAVGDYAGRLFDAHTADPSLARLLFWEGLERGGAPIGDEQRAACHRLKVDLVTEVLPGLPRADAGELLLTIVTLCDAWVVVRQLDALLIRPDERRLAARRAAIVETATLAAAAAWARAAPPGRPSDAPGSMSRSVR
jgi:AcrR family transcriptional regulator